jgi:hypothetical protein
MGCWPRLMVVARGYTNNNVVHAGESVGTGWRVEFFSRQAVDEYIFSRPTRGVNIILQ